jgi:hypothetical protein
LSIIGRFTSFTKTLDIVLILHDFKRNDGKNLASEGKPLTEEVVILRKDYEALILIETNHFIRVKGFPTWNAVMYIILINEYFPKEDEYLAVFQNIKMSEPYEIFTNPNIFPYSDIVRWIYSCL